ncbi:MAG: hypothetical protein ACLQPD_32070, partial [Desulfomonilaceae bacterium]
SSNFIWQSQDDNSFFLLNPIVNASYGMEWMLKRRAFMVRRTILAAIILIVSVFFFSPVVAQVKWSVPMNEYPNQWYPTAPPPAYNPYGYYYPGYGSGYAGGYGRYYQGGYGAYPQGGYSGNPYYYQQSQ